mgnify:CR=1 FL=1|tara:strand:- start:1298 stop:2095 length:798 start_codon:yes stop_codon:yes gene_type:complete
MSGNPEIVSFVEPLPSGSTQYFIGFPDYFAGPPLVTASLQNDATSQIVPYIISDISASGFNINFGTALSNEQYKLNVSAQVEGSHSIGDAADAYVPGQFNGTTLGVLATKIYDEEIGFFTSGSARTTEIGLIANWLEGHLGELNNLLFTSFSGYNPEGLNLEEQSILRELYLSEYNRKAHRKVLRGIDGSDGSPDFQVIREGDSMIQKSNKNVTAKSYREAYLDSQERVKELVYAYNLYGAKPNQVYGADAPTTGQNSALDGYYS